MNHHQREMHLASTGQSNPHFYYGIRELMPFDEGRRLSNGTIDYDFYRARARRLLSN